MSYANNQNFKEVKKGQYVIVYESTVYEGSFVAVDRAGEDLLIETHAKKDRISYPSGGFSNREELATFTEAVSLLMDLKWSRKLREFVTPQG